MQQIQFQKFLSYLKSFFSCCHGGKWLHADSLPMKIRVTLQDVYGNDPFDRSCDEWYQRFARYFLELGIPEGGVAGIIKNIQSISGWWNMRRKSRAVSHPKDVDVMS